MKLGERRRAQAVGRFASSSPDPDAILSTPQACTAAWCRLTVAEVTREFSITQDEILDLCFHFIYSSRSDPNIRCPARSRLSLSSHVSLESRNLLPTRYRTRGGLGAARSLLSSFLIRHHAVCVSAPARGVCLV